MYVRSKKTKPNQPGFWPESKRIEVVTTWMSTGSLPMTSAMTNVPKDTIKNWRKMPWWKEIEQSIKDEDNQELDAKFTKIIRKTLDTIDDRLENGNFQFDNKTGRVIRIPVNIRDTHRVMSDLVDKRKIIRNEPITTSTPEGVNDRLVKLAAQFAEFALGKKNMEMKVVGPVYEGDFSSEGDFEHAVHDQREEGHEEGEQAVQQPSGADQEASHA